MSRKTQEEKQFQEFYNTPVGILMSTIGNYNFVIQQMLKEHPDEKDLLSEFDISAQYMKKFVEAFENFDRITDYYIDDVNLVAAILEKMEEKDRNTVLQICGTYIQMMTRSKNDVPKALEVHLTQAITVYNQIAPVFMDINLGGERYAKVLRQIFRFSVKNAEMFINNPKNENDLEFGYQYKNYALIFRQKIKELKSDPDKIEFFHEFFQGLAVDEKDFFKKGILASFIDCCQSDIDNENRTFE
ncbi:MAG: hypothetical protein K5839_04855, partial [Treponemataceae bacterium]|nr:hypothetical protein [Treponemataceae bacterium]